MKQYPQLSKLQRPRASANDIRHTTQLMPTIAIGELKNPEKERKSNIFLLFSYSINQLLH